MPTPPADLGLPSSDTPAQASDEATRTEHIAAPGPPAPTPKPAPQIEQPTHPSQRWESAFVYSFIAKFTDLRKKVEGFETPMDFEQSLLFNGPDPVLAAILAQFVLNLRPSARNPTKNIERHVASVVDEYCKSTTERSIWWNDERKANLDPLLGSKGFFSLGWDQKLTILRQLVEWQLTHSTAIRNIIDTAWGVKAGRHKKKSEIEAVAPPPSEDPHSFESLRMIPYGQDSSRKRYWIADDSPRLYVSTNPWKSHCPFGAVSDTREEFMAVLADLQKKAPPEDPPPTKFGLGHLEMVRKLETEHLPKIDAELARVAKARKRMETKVILATQAELRTTRTRRQTRRPDYVYTDDMEEADDGADDYNFAEDLDIDFEDEDAAKPQLRRSSRSVTVNTRKRISDDTSEWRGERRSSRLGNVPAVEDEPPSKRSRSTMSRTSEEPNDSILMPPPPPPKNDVVKVDPPAGKKKSKFWYYAVETVPEPVPQASSSRASSSRSYNPASAPKAAHPGTKNRNGTNGTNGNGHAPAPSPAPEDVDTEMENGTTSNGHTNERTNGLGGGSPSNDAGSDMAVSDDDD